MRILLKITKTIPWLSRAGSFLLPQSVRSALMTSFIKPLVRRAGTAVSGYLLGLGVTAQSVDVIVAGVTTLLLVSVDLTLSHLDKGK